VAGETASASVRAVMASDIASIISDAAGREWACPNVDLSIYLARAPQGDWLLTDAETEQYGEGYGLISSVLSDTEGPFGYAHQTLLYSKVEDRGI
jgi:acyl-Coa thioesterase superfamily protein